MDSSAGLGGWGKSLKLSKEREESKQDEKKAVPIKKTGTIVKADPPFNVWPKEEPQHEIVYQWKCPQPTDEREKMKLVQAAYACAVHFMPRCTHVLIRYDSQPTGLRPKRSDFDK